MENKIDKKYLYKAIDELVALLGLKEPIGFDKILPPVDSFKDTERCIKEIANNLNLPIKVNIYFGDKFQSTQLVKTDKDGKGNEGITAQVNIPVNLPMFGMPGFKDFPIDITLSKNCATRPNAFMAVMAHELSHIILHSLNHPQKDNEYYTDLTAMILGFSNIMKIGRKFSISRTFGNYTETQTTKYGYLDDNQFDFAYNRIKELLEENRDKRQNYFNKLKSCKKRLKKFSLDIQTFEKYLSDLGKNHKNDIKKEDENKIALLYQPSHCDGYRQFNLRYQNILNEINKLSFGPEYYNRYGVENLERNNSIIESFLNELKKEKDLLKADIGTVEKYLSIFFIFSNNVSSFIKYLK
ncbi:MAG: hypothetical protein RBS77_03850 [Candidatus Moranbacteria bacterium]|jgi:hypothetical protein|nr:hypothetical protein [Candidatus Moranbacteria bacterium]